MLSYQKMKTILFLKLFTQNLDKKKKTCRYNSKKKLVQNIASPLVKYLPVVFDIFLKSHVTAFSSLLASSCSFNVVLATVGGPTVIHWIMFTINDPRLSNCSS